MGARRQFFSSMARRDIRGATAAVIRGVAINVDKMKGVDVNKKYGAGEPKDKPYQRPPERTP